MSNFPLAYRLSWLPRLLKASLAGDRSGFAPAAEALLDPRPARVARLAFIGDISAVANHTAPVVHPTIRNLLASADLVVANCESPVVETVRAPLGTALGIRHAMSERFLADALEAAGIARERLVLSVANNHALDQGVAGFDETRAALGRLGIRAAGLSEEPLARVAVGALTIGLAAFTQWRNAGREAFAGRVSMAVDPKAWTSSTDEGCDLLCCLPHWDREFRHFPRPETRKLAGKLAGAGAGLVIGGHAHVVQPIERPGGALVAYSLGDFLGTALARVPWPLRIGAMLAVDISTDETSRGQIAAYRLHPFFRLREAEHEHLVPAEALDGELRNKVARRLAMILDRGGA